MTSKEVRHSSISENEKPAASKLQIESTVSKQPANSPSSNRILSTIYWTPSWCRYNEDSPPNFNVWINILFACSSGLTAANLYYSAPILNVLARDFHTSESGVARIPSLAQAGSATGLLLLLPLADVLPKRRFALTLIAVSLLFWYVE